MNNKVAIEIMENISTQYEHPSEKRAFEKAIAALEYCQKNGLTYYVEGKYFDKREEDNA